MGPRAAAQLRAAPGPDLLRNPSNSPPIPLIMPWLRGLRRLGGEKLSRIDSAAWAHTQGTAERLFREARAAAEERGMWIVASKDT